MTHPPLPPPYVVVFVLLVIFLIGYLNFQSEREKYYEKYKVIDEGLNLIRDGKYEEGLSKCSEFTYYNTYVCHGAVVATKKKRGEPVTVEFCESIPTELKSNWPLTLKIFRLFENPNEADNFKKNSLDIIELCKQVSSST